MKIFKSISVCAATLAFASSMVGQSVKADDFDIKDTQKYPKYEELSYDDNMTLEEAYANEDLATEKKMK